MLPFKPDFHCHTTLSDGSLTPKELIERAVQFEVTHLAITDHDSTKGYEQAVPFAEKTNVELISGTEISCQWQKHTIHIVGLQMDIANQQLQAGLEQNCQIRIERAQAIDEKAKPRFGSLLEKIKPKLKEGMIGRNHFAQELIAQGIVSDQNQAFNKYLKQGRSLYAPVVWPELTEVVKWIVEAGGIAVIAHPHIYKMTKNKLNKMIEEFKQAGGKGIEVVCQPRVCSDQIGMADRAKRHGLYASLGSDFHRPEHTWRGLGWLATMPEGVDPIWNYLKQTKGLIR